MRSGVSALRGYEIRTPWCPLLPVSERNKVQLKDSALARGYTSAAKLPHGSQAGQPQRQISPKPPCRAGFSLEGKGRKEKEEEKMPMMLKPLRL